MAAPALSGFTRVTVAAVTTRADLAVPAAVPLAAVLPELLRRIGHDTRATVPGSTGWTLCRVDGAALELACSLRENGVHDGDVLVLHPAGTPVEAPLFDDVVELLGPAAGDPRWGPPQVRVAAAAVGAVAVLAGAAALVAVPGHGPGAATAVVVTVLLLLAGAAVARSLGDVACGRLLAVGAVPYVVVAGTGYAHGAVAVRLLVTCAALLVLASLVPVAVAGAEAVAAGLALAATGGVLTGAVAVLGGVGVTASLAVVSPLALVVTGLLPSAALRLARVPGPQLATNAEEEVDGAVDHEQLLVRVAAARALLTGMWCGALVVVAVGAVVLAGASGAWARTLAGILVLLVFLRARVPVSRAAVAVTVGLGVTSLACVAGRAVEAVDGVGPSAAIGALAAVTLAAAVGVGSAAGRRSGSPRARHLLDLADTLLLVAAVPVALGVWHAYDAVGRLGS